MIIKNLSLINYRNYKSFKEEFNEKFNIFYGKNGQGKTNILESIFLCAAGKSHRTSRDAELIMKGEDSFNINLNLLCNTGDRNINFSYNGQLKQKVIKVNENYLRKLGNLMGNLQVVIFSPEDLMIVKQGPVLRRRFIDITLSQIKPSYFFDLQQYNKIMAQRNALLKQIKRNKAVSGTLEIWNDSLAGVGSKIIFHRKIFLKELSDIIKKKHLYISNGSEELSLVYKPSFIKSEDLNDMSSGDLYNAFKKTLNDSQKIDIEREFTNHGPHRDDFIYNINGMELKIFGSQGQQRTAVLSTKLAELDIMKQQTGENPILLLDDVMSELDNDRQEFLFEKLSETQTFITCTDKNTVKNRLKIGATYYNIYKGEIISREIN